MRFLTALMIVGLVAGLSACGDTWRGVKKDTGENLEATGEAIKEGGEAIEGTAQ